MAVAKTSRPKLGQHFLRDTLYRRRIVEALTFCPDDLVLEIGPGRGAMTGLLAERARAVVAVELDAALAESLRKNLSRDPRIEVVRGDILATDLTAICRERGAAQCFVFGNLPYYITSPIIHHLFKFADRIRAMALLVQREVAERIVARPGRRDYGYLSVLAQVHSQPRILLRVPPGAFSPPPKVHSALVGFEMATRFPTWTMKEVGAFLEFVKRCFAQKRKNLLNNLATRYGRARVERELEARKLPPTARAEELMIEQLADVLGGLQ